jgi:hypothetical protein
MRFWSHVSSLLWEEPVVHAQEPLPTGPEATGVPEFARKAARFASIGFSAVVLAAQVTGVRLAASVDADPTYCVRQSQLCKAACNGTNPITGQPESQSQCVQRCNDQRKICERAP